MPKTTYSMTGLLSGQAGCNSLGRRSRWVRDFVLVGSTPREMESLWTSMPTKMIEGRTTKPPNFAGAKRVRSHTHSVTTVIAIWTSLACAPKTRSDHRALDSSDVTQSAARPARCYRSSNSVLLGPITKSKQNARGPGWLRVEGLPTADSGAGELVDASRAGLNGVWRRATGDSVSMTAADDFLRVELRLVISDSVAIGAAL